MIQTARFVGGEADGKTYAFPGFPPSWFKVAVAPPISIWVEQFSAPFESLDIETKIYRRHCLIGHDKNFWVFAPEDWTVDNVYEHLLFGEFTNA